MSALNNMVVRLPPISALASIPSGGFAICNSRGRRVSLLNDDDGCSYFPLPPQHPSPQYFPLSPAHSSDSDHCEHSFAPDYFNPLPPATPPSIPAVSPHLPPLNVLVSFVTPSCDSPKSYSRKSSVSSASGYSRGSSLASTTSRKGCSQSRHIKRRYECATCGKTFTTSGHVARHNRIHTGEKNFRCPEPGCELRFSRQDNCMQHYRTHKNHVPIRPETPYSPRTTPPLGLSTKMKGRLTEETDTPEALFDPNDRLNALATYISVYA